MNSIRGETQINIKQSCVIAQPTFMPWLGWFDLADQADTLIILDDVQFSKQSWQQRNRLPAPSGLALLTVPVISAGRSHQLINEVNLMQSSAIEKLLRSIQGYCGRAKYFKTYYLSLCEAIRKGAETGKLVDLNITIIQWSMHILNINVPMLRSSQLQACGKRGDYVAALCSEVSATRYLSPAGAKNYLLEDFSAFTKNGISVELHVYEHPEYQQCFNPFTPFASVIDLIFNEGPQALEILKSGRRPCLPLT